MITVAELFAGVGGFRLGLEGYQSLEHPEFNLSAAGPFKTIWGQSMGSLLEPRASSSLGAAMSSVLVKEAALTRTSTRFSTTTKPVKSISLTFRWSWRLSVPGLQRGKTAVCCSRNRGQEGRSWWDIYRFLHLKEPKYVLLENVDRLLKSPATQRGRDFAIILSCMADLGYSVEWHVVNSGEYGFNQRRKRVYIFAEMTSDNWDLSDRAKNGVMARAFPTEDPEKVFRVLRFSMTLMTFPSISTLLARNPRSALRV